MGNCPSGFTPMGALQCVVTCPSEKGLENRIVGNENQCVYDEDPTKSFVLKPAPQLMLRDDDKPTELTVDWIKTNRPEAYPAFKEAQDDYGVKSAVLLASIEKQIQIRDAFKALQTAENVRDQSPQAYQNARIRYYTLVKGDTWAEDERRRLLEAEVLPSLAPYVQSLNSATERQVQHTSTKTAVDAVKSKLLSLKSDFETTTNALSGQVTELQNQIELQKRRAVEVQQETSHWFLNLILIALLLVVIYLLYRRVTGTTGSPLSKRPAYTMLGSRS